MPVFACVSPKKWGLTLSETFQVWILGDSPAQWAALADGDTEENGKIAPESECSRPGRSVREKSFVVGCCRLVARRHERFLHRHDFRNNGRALAQDRLAGRVRAMFLARLELHF